jgi:hypothetical protein
MWLSTVLTETDSRSTIAVFERPAIVAAIDAERPRASTEPNTRALGEEQLDARLNGFASDLLRVPHDRRVPGTTANIDHLEVTPTGVFVIDAKKYKGHPRHKVEGGLLRPRASRSSWLAPETAPQSWTASSSRSRLSAASSVRRSHPPGALRREEGIRQRAAFRPPRTGGETTPAPTGRARGADR